jgi:hypothetical protein
MIWVAILLAGVVLLELLRRQRAFALAALLAAVGFALTITLMNVDGFIFQRNVTSFEMGNDLDVSYLASLSADAVPEMVAVYQSQPAGSVLGDRIGAALACIRHDDNARQKNQAWQSFHLSDYLATQALGSASKELGIYTIIDNDWPMKVKTPLGKTYQCNGATFD